MSSSLLSTLANLDDSAHTVEVQFDRLEAALPVNEDQLTPAIREACRHALLLSNLVREERPNAQWTDRASLDELIRELQAAAEARKNQQRRDRLFDLASELDTGRVKHRFESRTTALNAMRVEAVNELLTQAALPEQTKELPGPSTEAWLVWAFDLQDDNDAALLAELRATFPALERFTAEMEESYWVSERRTRSQPETAPEPVPEARQVAIPAGGALISDVEQPARSDAAKTSAVSANQTGDYAQTLAVAYERPAARPSVAETGAVAKTATPPPASASTATAPAAKVKATDRPSSPAIAAPIPIEVHPAQTAASLAEPVVKPSSKQADDTSVGDIDEKSSASSEAAPPFADEAETSPLPSGVITLRKQSVVLWAGAGGFVLLSVLIFALVYHLHSSASPKSGATVEAALASEAASASQGSDIPANPAAADAAASKLAPTSPADSKPQGPQLHKQPAEGAQDSILLSVENCDRHNPGNIECWGYASNLGGATSRVSLDRVDVVDGRGNSFSLDRNGQFAFPTGATSSIAAGSRVRFNVKVPDKDADARTLTLYMDLSNPRSLEYTFRDVPIAQ